MKLDIEKPCIYFLEDFKGFIKIGHSKDPFSRLKNLQVAQSDSLKIIGVIPNCSSKIETQLHRKFKSSNIKGEWFKPSKDILLFIKKNCLSFSEYQIIRKPFEKITARQPKEIVLKQMLEREILFSNESLNSISRNTGIPLSVLHGWVKGVLPSARNLYQVQILAQYFKLEFSEILFGL